MPVFYLHLRGPGVDVTDQEGIDRATMADLRATVLVNARDLVAAGVREGVLDLTPRIDVEDAAGSPVYTLQFVDAVTVVPLDTGHREANSRSNMG